VLLLYYGAQGSLVCRHAKYPHLTTPDPDHRIAQTLQQSLYIPQEYRTAEEAQQNYHYPYQGDSEVTTTKTPTIIPLISDHVNIPDVSLSPSFSTLHNLA
jgi:hypothetical protein